MELYDLVQRTMARWGYPEDEPEPEVCENNIYPQECDHPYCPEHSEDRNDPPSWPVEGT